MKHIVNLLFRNHPHQTYTIVDISLKQAHDHIFVSILPISDLVILNGFVPISHLTIIPIHNVWYPGPIPSHRLSHTSHAFKS